MLNKLPQRVAHALQYIKREWPQLIPYIPEESDPFDPGFGIGTGICIYKELIGERLMTSIGYKESAKTFYPEGFHCIGIQNRGSSEYLFVMWCREGRKFWFYDQYVVFVHESASVSQDQTSKRLNIALEKWEKAESDVYFWQEIIHDLQSD